MEKQSKSSLMLPNHRKCYIMLIKVFYTPPKMPLGCTLTDMQINET